VRGGAVETPIVLYGGWRCDALELRLGTGVHKTRQDESAIRLGDSAIRRTTKDGTRSCVVGAAREVRC